MLTRAHRRKLEVSLLELLKCPDFKEIQIKQHKLFECLTNQQQQKQHDLDYRCGNTDV